MVISTGPVFAVVISVMCWSIFLGLRGEVRALEDGGAAAGDARDA